MERGTHVPPTAETRNSFPDIEKQGGLTHWQSVIPVYEYKDHRFHLCGDGDRLTVAASDSHEICTDATHATGSKTIFLFAFDSPDMSA